MLFQKINRVSPAQIIMGGFLIIILLGTFLLMLPVATRTGTGASFFDALFTSTSATCVTGLVLYDTYSHWSSFGQGVILCLIQIGGMGVVTIALAIFIFSGRKIGLKERFVMQESISAPQMGGIVRLTAFILKTVLFFEIVGVFLLALRFCPQMGMSQGLWFSVFHSISAFCNAGFDLFGKYDPYSSLTHYLGDPLVVVAVMLLIVVGGAGFFVWSDVRQNKFRFHSYRLQTKLVICTSAILILFPALYLFFYEFDSATWSHLTLDERILASLFQSVTPRTAGFNTVDVKDFHPSGILILILLMLIGGSPGSTAGGFKTTSLAVIFLCTRSVFLRTESIRVFHRRIPWELLRSTITILTLYIVLFLSGGLLICELDNVPLSSALFECASAIGTVGLSLGITSTLSFSSRLILIFLMYVGRVGGLTMLYAVMNTRPPAPGQMPVEKITVG